MSWGAAVLFGLDSGGPIVSFDVDDVKGPSRALSRVSRTGGATKATTYQHNAGDGGTIAAFLPREQTWSPISEIGISALQFEHLMDGKKLDARVADAMVAFHLPLDPVLRNALLGHASTQRFVYFPRLFADSQNANSFLFSEPQD